MNAFSLVASLVITPQPSVSEPVPAVVVMAIIGAQRKFLVGKF